VLVSQSLDFTKLSIISAPQTLKRGPFSLAGVTFYHCAIPKQLIKLTLAVKLVS
jgi:hypothetical protein